MLLASNEANTKEYECLLTIIPKLFMVGPIVETEDADKETRAPDENGYKWCEICVI